MGETKLWFLCSFFPRALKKGLLKVFSVHILPSKREVMTLSGVKTVF